MAVYEDREAFIPIRKGDLVKKLLSDPHLKEDDRESFEAFCTLVQSMFHFKFHDDLETLKNKYHPFNPDADTIDIHELSAEERKAAMADLLETFERVLSGANYQQLTEKDIEVALDDESAGWGINLEVDFDEFEVLRLYARDNKEIEVTVRSWKSLFRKKATKNEVFGRLAMIIKFKDHGENEGKKKTKTEGKDHERIYIKLFKNIPKADLEMLFPNTTIRMKSIDKLKISVPMLIGLVTLAAKFGAALVVLTLVLLQFRSSPPEVPYFVMEHPSGDAVYYSISTGDLLTEKDNLPELTEPISVSVEKVGGSETDVRELKAREEIYPDHLDRDINDYFVDPLTGLALDADGKYYRPRRQETDPVVGYYQDQSGVFRISTPSSDKKKQEIGASFPGLRIPKDDESLHLGVLIGILAALGGYLFKSVKNYLNMKTKYHGVLVSNLFYLNLDNNAGVFGQVIDSAEEEECKEAFLAYFFMWTLRDHKEWTESDLDDYIEGYVEKETGLKVDFEVDDALRKLEELNIMVDLEDMEKIALVEEALSEQTKLTPDMKDMKTWTVFLREEEDEATGRKSTRKCAVAPLPVAKSLLDYEWDNYFDFNG
ncbi:MAG: TMEM143 family protein [Planctomycetes bacterium]|nr:TMEM143 family protein [Planctomycetota bacterium]